RLATCATSSSRSRSRRSEGAPMKHATLLAAGICAVLAAPLAAKDIQLPPDAVQLKPSPLPGYAKAQANCTMCHSAEYMRMQPPSAARPYWDAMVHRMKTVF